MSLLELLHLANKGLLQILVHNLRLMHLLLFNHIAHSVSTVVVLHGEENLLLLPHLNQTLAIALSHKECFRDLLLMQSKFLLLLNLKLLNQFKSGGLIVTHVLVPGFREFCEL